MLKPFQDFAPPERDAWRVSAALCLLAAAIAWFSALSPAGGRHWGLFLLAGIALLGAVSSGALAVHAEFRQVCAYRDYLATQPFAAVERAWLSCSLHPFAEGVVTQYVIDYLNGWLAAETKPISPERSNAQTLA